MSIGRYILSIRLAIEYQAKLLAAKIHWRRPNFNGSPILFANAMPKSGSKLLMQIMEGIQRVAPFAPVRQWPFRMLSDDGSLLSEEAIAFRLCALRPGDIGMGYLHATDGILDLLSREGWCSFFLIRDPRDMLVSHVHYALNMHKGHTMRSIYQDLPDLESRLEVAIRGTRDYPYLPSIRKRFERFMGFINRPEICLLRFEDIRRNQEKSIRRILSHILSRSNLDISADEKTIASISSAVRSSRSPTFRRGIVGEWKESFTPRIRYLFHEIAGDLLVTLGYEEDDRWLAE